eukprot:gb/GECG01000076.1/.p1 GENE.gb/GECG01000076.1/~~gb/GECG01000076.1/.p1  ORF type:complete len:968 (+),score=91.93 gb/GECG01000076.1/:1-2904(+)
MEKMIRGGYDGLSQDWRNAVIRSKLQSLVIHEQNRLFSQPSLAASTAARTAETHQIGSDHSIVGSQVSGHQASPQRNAEVPGQPPMETGEEDENEYLIPVSVAFCPASSKSHILAAAGEAGVIEFYNSSNPNGLQECTEDLIHCHRDAIFALEWTKTGRFLATASGDHTSCIVDVAAKKPMQYLEGHRGSVKALKWSDTHPEQILATGARDGHINLYDLRTPNKANRRNPQCSIPAHCGTSKCSRAPSGVSSVEMLHSCNLLISGGTSTDAVKLWDMRMIPVGSVSQTQCYTSRCSPVQTLYSSSSCIPQLYPRICKASQKDSRYKSVPEAMERVLGKSRTLRCGYIPRNGKHVCSHPPCLSPCYDMLTHANFSRHIEHHYSFEYDEAAELDINDLLQRYSGHISVLPEEGTESLSPMEFVESTAKSVLECFDEDYDFIRSWSQTFGTQSSVEQVLQQLHTDVEKREINPAPQSHVSVLNLQVSPNQQDLLVNYSNNSIRVYNLSQPRELEYDEYISDDFHTSFNRASWDPTGNFIAATAGTTLRFWQHKYSTLPIASMYVPDSGTSTKFPWITGMSWRKDGGAIAHCGDDQYITVAHLATSLAPSISANAYQTGEITTTQELRGFHCLEQRIQEKLDVPIETVARTPVSDRHPVGNHLNKQLSEFLQQYQLLVGSVTSGLSTSPKHDQSAVLNTLEEALDRVPAFQNGPFFRTTEVPSKKHEHCVETECPLQLNIPKLRFLDAVNDEAPSPAQAFLWLVTFWFAEISSSDVGETTLAKLVSIVKQTSQRFTKTTSSSDKSNDCVESYINKYTKHFSSTFRHHTKRKVEVLGRLGCNTTRIYSVAYDGPVFALVPVTHYDVMQGLCIESYRYLRNRKRLCDFFSLVKSRMVASPTPIPLPSTNENSPPTDTVISTKQDTRKEGNSSSDKESLKRTYRGTLSSIWGVPSPDKRQRKRSRSKVVSGKPS